MRTITVMDMDQGVLSFDLRDLLACVAPVAVQMDWRVQTLEYTGERAEQLHALVDQGHLITGASLVMIADGVDQVIEGELFGYMQGDATPALVLRAVDSTRWDVASPSEALLDEFRKKYRVVIDVEDVPG